MVIFCSVLATKQATDPEPGFYRLKSQSPHHKPGRRMAVVLFEDAGYSCRSPAASLHYRQSRSAHKGCATTPSLSFYLVLLPAVITAPLAFFVLIHSVSSQARPVSLPIHPIQQHFGLAKLMSPRPDQPALSAVTPAFAPTRLDHCR